MRLKMYNQQKIVMYCPPVYLTDSESSLKRYSYFEKVGARFLFSPQYMKDTPSLLRGIKRQGYAIDNGAYLDFLHNKNFDDCRFLSFCEKYIHGADWVVLPDVVCNRKQTIEKSKEYVSILKTMKKDVRLFFVWQDGMITKDIIPFLEQKIGIFVGGSTEGKIKNISWIAQLAKKYHCWVHVGRVNTLKRLNLIMYNQANSFDGSGITRFLPTLELLSNRIIQERRQLSLFTRSSNMTVDFINRWIQTGANI